MGGERLLSPPPPRQTLHRWLCTVQKLCTPAERVGSSWYIIIIIIINRYCKHDREMFVFQKLNFIAFELERTCGDFDEIDTNVYEQGAIDRLSHYHFVSLFSRIIVQSGNRWHSSGSSAAMTLCSVKQNKNIILFSGRRCGEAMGEVFCTQVSA